MANADNVSNNFKDPDPTKAHEWENATPAQLNPQPEILWGGPNLPGSFPDYDPLHADETVFPPVELMPGTLVPDEVTDGFENTPFHDLFTDYPGEWEPVGVPSRAYTFQDVANLLTAAQLPTRNLMQGAGVLYGATAFSIATAVTPFTVLTDSLDGNGPVLFIMANNVVQTGYFSFGTQGIRFENGLTLSYLTTAPGTPGAQLAFIPIIKRERLTTRKIR